MVVEAPPTAPFVISKAEFLLEFLVVALDPPAQFRQIDEAVEGDVFGHSGEPIFDRFGLALGPLDQQPLLGARRGAPSVAMRRACPHAGKARGQPIRASLAPGDIVPGLGRQLVGERLDADRVVLAIAPQQPGRPSAAAAAARAPFPAATPRYWRRSRRHSSGPAS